MEKSPLRFLDYDVSIYLGEQIRIYREDKAREFHIHNFENAIDENKLFHYEISWIYSEYINKLWNFYWENFYLDNLNEENRVKERIKLFEDELEMYNENTRLQRCSL